MSDTYYTTDIQPSAIEFKEDSIVLTFPRTILSRMIQADYSSMCGGDDDTAVYAVASGIASIAKQFEDEYVKAVAQAIKEYGIGADTFLSLVANCSVDAKFYGPILDALEALAAEGDKTFTEKDRAEGRVPSTEWWPLTREEIIKELQKKGLEIV